VSAPAAGVRANAWLRAGIALALCALCAAVFWPVLGFDFVSYDDWRLVRDNPQLRDGLSAQAALRALREPYYLNWIPLTTLSYLLDAELFGIAPRGFHATSLLCHALATALLFLALDRLTRETWASAFAAAVFAVHPLHVEPVAWIASRKDVLSGVGFGLSLWCYARYAERPGARRQLALVAAAALGLLAKPVLLALPAVLLLLDLWPLRRPGLASWRGRAALVAEKLPLLALCAAVAAIAFSVQPVVGAGGHSLEVRLANAIDALGAYLLDTLWPVGLAAFYPHPGAAVPGARVVAAAFALALWTTLCLASFRRRPWLAVGWGVCLALLAPVLGLVEIGLQARADRYMYLPLAGLACIAAWEGLAFARRGAWRRRAARAAGAALLLALSLASRAQLAHWRDSEALYARAVAVTQGNYVAHYGLAGVQAERGRLAEAQAQLRLALAANPDWTLAWDRLALLELHQGRPESALALYRQLLAARPGDAALQLGAAASALGAGLDAEALAYAREAARLAGGWREPAHQLAWLLATLPDPALRDPAESLRLADALLAAAPAREPALLDLLAAAHAASGDFAAARAHADEARRGAEQRGDVAQARAIGARLAAYAAGELPVAERPLALHAPLLEQGDAPLR
jgi:hypothetical protein